MLIDSQGQPHLADFGLVLREEDVGNQSRYAGTPAYMSPEQAAGEGHLVDGRSDIFSLGIVFYELLVGRRPFGGSKEEVMRNIVTSQPRPLRQYHGELPRELERICMKALSKRISRRYSTARDLADDLHAFLALSSSVSSAPASTTLLYSAAPDSSGSHSSLNSSASDSVVAVIPRGLRSFDSRDKDFFLELLPGPRNREGLPESVWFWKTQIEETDRDKTFSVGLIYGPSGCGKSSLVKAGLLPQLSDDVTTIYIEATSVGTEETLRQQLKMRFSELTNDLDLGQSMAAIRRRPIMSGHKLLIIIDQFEQWLHVQQGSENCGLLAALRQCDGQHVQCILMVRDDFWLSISRLMLELDVDLVPGHNIALVDLFDEDHARNVLAAFGRAFGKLPKKPSEMSKQQVDFLDRVIGALSQDGKVVCVRLALFAEMLKGKPWTSETLKAVGGTEGVGVAFLNETFDSRGSNPSYRAHREAAQLVLKALLPEVGSDIKGKMQFSEELLKVSGYQDQPQHFENLIRILDSELRLITPTETAESNNGDDQSTATRSRYFLLTHDYLVHVVRQWIAQSQRETRRGRARMRLEERTREWQSRRTNRYLPTWWGYANIRLFTRKSQWNTTQQQMMNNARNLHGIRWGGGLLAVFMVAFGALNLLSSVRFQHQSEQIEIATTTLLSSRGTSVPRAIDDLAKFPRAIVTQKLRDRQESADPYERLTLSYALAALDGLNGPQELIDQIGFTSGPDVPNLVDAMQRTNSESLELLRKAFADLDDGANRERAKIAILTLYLGDIDPAKVMCRRAADPIQRTWFIEQHGNWHGRISELVEIAEGVDDPDLQSGLCLAVGSTELDPMFPGERETWRPLASQWYQSSPDSGVHGAAAWMLRRWKMKLPVIASTFEPPENKNWHVTPSGMTMVKIPAGTFLNRMKGDWTPFDKDTPSQKITLTRDFLMSDREVSLGQFRQAMEDPDVGLRERPYLRYDDDDDLQAEIYRSRADLVFEPLYQVLGPRDEHPVTRVSWIQAVMYCNWLSRKEGLQPCYERTGKIHRSVYHHFPSEPRWSTEDWRLIPGRNGYRLPTNAEWELACRASTTTDYSFGNDTQFMGRYAVCDQSSTEPCGSKLPNGRGLFDMHGNLSELCNDWVRTFRCDTQSKTDPMGPSQPVYLKPNYPDSSPESTFRHWRKVRSGGDFRKKDPVINKASFLDSEHPIHQETPDTGFRVVRNLE
ncbi:MAG: sulfatase activating formylglycine-generating enzyme [Mariniblastus sp.]